MEFYLEAIVRIIPESSYFLDIERRNSEYSQSFAMLIGKDLLLIDMWDWCYTKI